MRNGTGLFGTVSLFPQPRAHMCSDHVTIYDYDSVHHVNVSWARTQTKTIIETSSPHDQCIIIECFEITF